MTSFAHLALEFLGNLTSGSGGLLNIGVTLSNEDEQVVLDLTAKDLLGALVVELDDQRQGFRLDELDNGLGRDVTLQSGLGVIKGLEEENTGVSDLVLLQDFSGRADTKTEIVHLLGGRHELLGSFGFQILF